AHGIGYFYEFAKDRQTLVLADIPTSYPVAPGAKRKVGVLEADDRDEESFVEWWPSRHFATETMLRNDYDFRKPFAALKTDSSGNAGYRHHGLMDDAFPFHQALGETISEAEGLGYTLAAVDAEQASDRRAMGYGDAVTLSAGTRVQIEDFPKAGNAHEYLILTIHHEFHGNAYRPGPDGHISYQCNIEAMSTATNFAPARVTPKPRIAGVQTGRVVGQDEFETDEFGRLKVFFHWMDMGKENEPEGTSMWCRVAQVWSGPSWGGQFIPRAGMEVLVQFIDGDPDQPVIVGTLYNGENKFPFQLPDDKYTSGWKSHSAYGNDEDYNEISMKDDAGEELLKFHAQKDLLTEVEADEKREIGTDRATTVGNNDTLDVQSKITITAGTSITLKVGGSTIVIDQTSITLTSTTVKIDSTSFEAEGKAMAKVVAGGQLTLTGALVKIN
ncbi:MAG TPA: type VI secretion system tip protein TssI/VgrG, partial [Devosia sp.]|nr:type VI secretion system tip protein TssI/VgrG [Devosia sp.]